MLSSTAGGDGGTALITFRSVSRVFVSEAETVRAVDDVTLSMSEGEFVCLFGHSGSGKTTLLNLAGGLDLPTSGSVEVLGRSVSDLGENARVALRRESVGIVHQTDQLIEEFTAVENVALPLEARGMTFRETAGQATGLLAKVGLDGYGDRRPRQLSGGQRQRVGIARALSGGRRILLADEPTGSLDTHNSSAIFGLLKALATDGCLVVVSSHDPACRDYASRVIGLRDGRVQVDESLC